MLIETARGWLWNDVILTFGPPDVLDVDGGLFAALLTLVAGGACVPLPLTGLKAAMSSSN